MSVSAEDEHVGVGVDVAGVSVSGLGLDVVDEPEFIFLVIRLVVVMPVFPFTHLLVVGVEAHVAVLDDE